MNNTVSTVVLLVDYDVEEASRYIEQVLSMKALELGTYEEVIETGKGCIVRLDTLVYSLFDSNFRPEPEFIYFEVKEGVNEVSLYRGESILQSVSNLWNLDEVFYLHTNIECISKLLD